MRAKRRTLVEHPQHISYEENQQYGAESDARTATVTPSAVAVVSPTAT
jgi:hypothetical protein